VYSLDLFAFRIYIYISVASETGEISDRHGGMERLSLLLDKIDFYIAKARNETYFERLNNREFSQEILTKVSSVFEEMETGKTCRKHIEGLK